MTDRQPSWVPSRAPSPAPIPAAVVARLRAAGCVFAEDEARLLISAAASPADLEAMVARRVTGVPLECILGWVDFAGLRIAVEPGVFVPRRRTELIVRDAIAAARESTAARGSTAAARDELLGTEAEVGAPWPSRTRCRPGSGSSPFVQGLSWARVLLY